MSHLVGCKVECDERYPDYDLKPRMKNDGTLFQCDLHLTEAEFEDWVEVRNRYESWQERIHEMKSGPRKPWEPTEDTK